MPGAYGACRLLPDNDMLSPTKPVWCLPAAFALGAGFTAGLVTGWWAVSAAAGAGLVATMVLCHRAVVASNREFEESRRAADFFREFFRHGPVCFHSLDADGRYLEVNDTEVAELRTAREALLGRPISEFMTPDSAAAFGQRYPAFKERGEGSNEYEFRRGDGTTVTLRIRAIAIRDGAGRFERTFSAGMNVTQQSTLLKQVQQHARDLETLNDALDQATRFKTQFLASQAHELRTPINAVIGFAELLRDEVFGPLNDKQKDYVHEILQSGRHLITLIGNVMDLSRIEAGSLGLEPASIDLVVPMAEAMALLKQDAERRRIQLRAVAVPGVVEVYADPNRLRQVFLNLISNGLRFTPENGTVEFSAEREGDWVEIRVRDTGVGIALEDQARIFAPFEQAGASLDRERRGSGLGLAITKTLIELHGGSINLESEVGHGTTFFVRLPATRREFESAALRTPAPLRRSSTPRAAKANR